MSERVANRDPALWSVQERAARQANSWRAKGAQEAGRWVNGKAWVENR